MFVSSGETNPFEEKSFTDLTLRQRVLILKVLCDECLVSNLRDFVHIMKMDRSILCKINQDMCMLIFKYGR